MTYGAVPPPRNDLRNVKEEMMELKLENLWLVKGLVVKIDLSITDKKKGGVPYRLLSGTRIGQVIKGKMVLEPTKEVPTRNFIIKVNDWIVFRKRSEIVSSTEYHHVEYEDVIGKFVE